MGLLVSVIFKSHVQKGSGMKVKKAFPLLLLTGLVICIPPGAWSGPAPYVPVDTQDLSNVVEHTSSKPGATRSRGTSVRSFRFDHGAGEPTLGVNADGDVFAILMDASILSDGRAIFRTTDQGNTWTDVRPYVGPVDAHPLSLDPYLFLDDTEGADRLFSIDLYVACSELSFSDDKGATWTHNPLACGEPVNDHQTLFAGRPISSPTLNYPNILYYCFNHPGFTKCNKSLDGGLTFIPTTNIVSLNCTGLNGHGISDSKGTIYVPINGCGVPTVAISHDEANTWEVIAVSDLRMPEIGPGVDPSVAVDTKGNLYYVFGARTQGAPLITPMLTVSKDGGKSWSDPVKIAPPGVKTVNLVTVDAGKPGHVAVAYYGSSTGREWSGYLAIGTNVLGPRPTFSTGAVNPPSKPIKRGTCGPGRCGQVFDFIDVEIDPFGRPWGVFVDACLEECERTGQESASDSQGLVATMIGGTPLK